MPRDLKDTGFWRKVPGKRNGFPYIWRKITEHTWTGEQPTTGAQGSMAVSYSRISPIVLCIHLFQNSTAIVHADPSHAVPHPHPMPTAFKLQSTLCIIPNYATVCPSISSWKLFSLGVLILMNPPGDLGINVLQVLNHWDVLPWKDSHILQ